MGVLTNDFFHAWVQRGYHGLHRALQKQEHVLKWYSLIQVSTTCACILLTGTGISVGQKTTNIVKVNQSDALFTSLNVLMSSVGAFNQHPAGSFSYNCQAPGNDHVTTFHWVKTYIFK